MRFLPLTVWLGGIVACTGDTGPAGPAGPNGVDGTNGTSSLVTVTAEPAGANCEAGGQRIDVGIDDDADGTLDPEEIDSTSYVCAGAPGRTSLVEVSPEPAGANCSAGGQRIQSGVDDNNNNMLEPEEVDETTYVCDGDDGSSTLIDVRGEPAGANCAAGGQRIDAGRDDDGDGVLDPEEIEDTAYVCNGESTAGVPPGAALWLRMEDDPADGAIDSAGSNTITCASGACPSVVQAQRGLGYQMTNDRLTVAAAPGLQPGMAFTLSTWLRMDSTPTENTVVACKNVGTLDCSYAILVQPDLRVVYYTSAGAHLVSTTTLAIGTWNHVTVTWDGTTKRGYLNGVADGSATVSITSDATQPLTIGQRNYASNPLPLPGTVDELVFYNRVLSASEISSLAAR